MFSRVHDAQQLFGSLNLFRHGADEFFFGHQAHQEVEKDQESESKLLTNVYDNGDALLMQVAVAGVSKEDLTVQLQGKQLFIKGERKHEVPEGYTVHQQNLAATPFSRAYTLPLDIAGDEVTSSLVDGILILTLPKAAEVKKREITIQ